MWLFWITIVFSVGYLVAYPGLGQIPGVLGWTSAEAHATESAAANAKVKPLYDKFLAMDLEGRRGRSAGARDGRAALPQRVRAMSRLGCGRQPRLSQPARQRLALRRRAGDHSRIDHERPHGRDAGAGRRARRRGHQERRRVRALAVRPSARRPARAARQADLRAELRGVPRHGRQGQPGRGRAEPHGRHLALRQLRGDHHRGHQQGPPRRRRRRALADAGAQGHAGRG